MFESILSNTTSSLTYSTAIYCMLAALVFGIINASVHMLNKKYSKNFIIVVALLPLIVQVIVVMVNGNLGTSIAILGAFSLVRFRSIPGTSRELLSIFISMAIGLATGMGHILFAAVFLVLASLMSIIYTKIPFGENKREYKTLRILIPEDLNYDDVFKEIFDKYTKEVNLEKIKTTNMGSLYELTYSVIISDSINEKGFIDELRCRNGNLTISLYKKELEYNEL